MTSPLPTPVPSGTAENLARIARFRTLENVQPEELDAVAYFLIGDVGGPLEAARLWEQLRETDCHWLWFLITDDWDERDLDELTDREWARCGSVSAEQEIDARYVKTRERLAHQIEHAIHLARYSAVEAKRAKARADHRTDVLARIHPLVPVPDGAA